MDRASSFGAYGQLQSRWRGDVAGPLLRHPGQRLVELDKRNKLYSDYETRTVAAIRSALAGIGTGLTTSTQVQLDRSSYVRAFWVLVFGLLAILFNTYRSRLNRELEHERMVIDVLQRAFRSESIPLPNCEVGSAYLSATSHAAVGGDVFDVYRLSAARALVLIADISGKGVDAAVLTAFIKFMIRAIALRQSEPAAILSEFNVAFSKAVGNPYLFVSMFVGVLDTTTFRLEYGSAGHDCAFLRRDGQVEQLAVTGPVLGVMDEPFYSKTLELDPGDTIVLSTDGLTEVRNRAGEQLLAAGAMVLIERSATARAAARRRAGRRGSSARRKPVARRSCDSRDSHVGFGAGAWIGSRWHSYSFGCRRSRPALADCKVHRGDHVVLYSTTDDPSVLIWDSRARLREYHAASFDAAQAMLPHAVLVSPGTHATVVSCVPSTSNRRSLKSPTMQSASRSRADRSAAHALGSWLRRAAR